MCEHQQDAQDVLQETLLAMARGLEDLREPDALLSWAYRIARGFCTKKRRRSKFAPPAERSLEREARPPADPDQNPEGAYSGAQLAEALQKAIAGLRPDQREVLLLRDVEGLTAPEVSEALGIGVRAVKSRLHRARASMRQQLAPFLERWEAAGPYTAEERDAATERDASREKAERCPDTVRLFSRHLEGELGPADCRKMQRHLAGCEPCRARCRSLKKTLALCAESASAELPEVTKEAVKKALRAYLSEADRKRPVG